MAVKDDEGSKIIVDLRDEDVLFGRGPHLRVFPGNATFRKLIEKFSGDYHNSADYCGKECASWSVIQAIEKTGGRFLCAVEENVNKNKGKSASTVAPAAASNKWQEATQRKVLRKVKQAFRDHSQGSKRSSKASALSVKPTTTASSLPSAASVPIETIYSQMMPVPARAAPDTLQDRQNLAQSVLILDQLKRQNDLLSRQIEDLLSMGILPSSASGSARLNSGQSSFSFGPMGGGQPR